jgi:SAM-dependent methyltransferase
LRSDSAYHAALGAYFSAEADLLDTLDIENPIHAYIRRESLRTLRASFDPPGPLLEFGYGTGTEAIELAKAGSSVVGLDPSPQMQVRAREKAKTAGVNEKCDFRLGSTADTAALLDQFGKARFRGCFATLGPLNCEPDLLTFARGVADLLAPETRLVALVLNRNCFWETSLNLSKGDFRRAFRRHVPSWSVITDRHNGGSLPVFTYSPRSFAHFFRRSFEIEGLIGLPSVLPPPHAAPAFSRVHGLLPLLERADARLRARWPMRSLGDHFQIVLRRR